MQNKNGSGPVKTPKGPICLGPTQIQSKFYIWHYYLQHTPSTRGGVRSNRDQFKRTV